MERVLTLTKNSYSDNSNSFRIFALFGSLYYSGTSEYQKPTRFVSLGDEELTKMCMNLSESSLAKDWEGEDDEYWASFLKD